MDTKFLITFKTILDTGSFQNAANKLGYTQSAVTFQIRQLEEEFSIQLFEKIGRKMHLTQAGKDILPYVDTILGATQQITNYSNAIGELTGTLEIAMPESLLVYKMQPVLKAYKQKAPGITLSLHSYGCYKVNSNLVNGEIDIGLQYDIEGCSDCIKMEALEDITLTMVGSGDLPDTDLAQIPENTSLIVSSDLEDACRVIVTDFLRREGIAMADTMELGSIEAIKRSVINNLGIAYLPRHIVEEELARGTLKEIQSDISSKTVTIVYAYHKNKVVTPAMELFMELAKEPHKTTSVQKV